MTRREVAERFLDRRPVRFRRRSSPAGRMRRPRRWRVSGRLVAANTHERRNELFSIEAEARPNHWAVFTLGRRAILAPITYSFQIGFGLATQGIDRECLPSLRGDGF